MNKERITLNDQHVKQKYVGRQQERLILEISLEFLSFSSRLTL